jgi:hypothetical protein
MHVAIDDATRLAYVGVLLDEQKVTTIGFLALAVGWLRQQASPADAFSRKTALPTDQEPGARPAGNAISGRSAQSRIRPARTARPSSPSRPCDGNRHMHVVTDFRGAEDVACSLSGALLRTQVQHGSSGLRPQQHLAALHAESLGETAQLSIWDFGAARAHGKGVTYQLGLALTHLQSQVPCGTKHINNRP